MNTFTMIVARRPISANKGPNPRYAEALREIARSKQPKVLNGPLYARILWFHKDWTTQDIDNIVKRILDSLKGLVFDDDGTISHFLAARIDATMDYELSGTPSSDEDTELLLGFLADDFERHVLYIEIGLRTSAVVSFGEVL